MMTTESELEALLNAMGDTPYQVAETLRQAEIKGVRNRGESCPVAQYVKAKTEAANVNIGWRCTLYAGLGLEPTQIATPDGVWDFITQFDDGEWNEFVLS